MRELYCIQLCLNTAVFKNFKEKEPLGQEDISTAFKNKSFTPLTKNILRYEGSQSGNITWW